MNRVLRTFIPEEPPDIKVVIQDSLGNYLATGEANFVFTTDRGHAAIFDLRSDNVEEQLRQLQKSHGVQLIADPVPLTEIYEMCDRCRELFIPWMIYFDGKRFFCPDCRKLVSPRIRR